MSYRGIEPPPMTLCKCEYATADNADIWPICLFCGTMPTRALLLLCADKFVFPDNSPPPPLAVSPPLATLFWCIWLWWWWCCVLLKLNCNCCCCVDCCVLDVFDCDWFVLLLLLLLLLLCRIFGASISDSSDESRCCLSEPPLLERDNGKIEIRFRFGLLIRWWDVGDADRRGGFRSIQSNVSIPLENAFDAPQFKSAQFNRIFHKIR